MSEIKEREIHKRNKSQKINHDSTYLERISKLCNEIDPYQPLSNEVLRELNDLGIKDTQNPFSITNQLLQILDKLQHRNIQ
ncbi:MAG: hypothetical protein H6622_14745 [Halobacteriovoraceae bacterium]|nr:hypothetical protein [Halobacteriovoraceae bacterium]